jgi:Flp pilus assembly protein TadD
MRTPVMLALAALSLSACAANRTAPLAETGYAPGALAVAAIARGDWARAEVLLTDRSRGAADDPARLINLGKVYWETGRREPARAAWRRALASNQAVEVETRGGRTVSTLQLAREALDAHDARPAQVVAARR